MYIIKVFMKWWLYISELSEICFIEEGCFIKEINYAVKDYLNEDSVDYAILINGKWGSGKTYYWKNYLEKIIIDKGITTLYISLNGVDSINEIGKKIFF